MRIHLFMGINRSANDTFNMSFCCRESNLRDVEKLSQSVNTLEINTCMANWSWSGASFIILALAQVQGGMRGVFEVQVRHSVVWNRPYSVGTGGFTSREEAN
ncbi:hypothetical protein AMECASPLE_013489 [Ameca splendens]|uniref:Uncharacterized protein n=1 Tax=Ameca splendens TaxID=208324 RepID=A0ABV0ZZ67_9TELE